MTRNIMNSEDTRNEFRLGKYRAILGPVTERVHISQYELSHNHRPFILPPL